MKIQLWVIVILAATIVVLLYPLTKPQPFIFFLLIIIFTDIIVSIGLNLLIGYAGIFFVSPGLFVGVGGYAAGWLSVNAGLSPFVSIFIGGVVALISSLMFSLVSGRLRGFYMAVYSVIFTLLLGTVFIHTEEWIMYWTGGPFGILDIPDIHVGGLSFRNFAGAPYYYFTFSLVLISIVLVRKLLRSNFGLALRTIRDEETYAATLGVDAFRVRLYIFSIASFLMGISGAIAGHFLGAFGLSTFTFTQLLHYHFQVVVGGIGSFTGPIIGGFLMDIYDEALATYGVYLLLGKGIIIITVLIFMPRGIAGYFEDLLASKRGLTAKPIPTILLQKIKESLRTPPHKRVLST